MFIAMNRFRVAPGKEAAFEGIWQERQSHLRAVPGFVVFHLLRGGSTEEYTLFASHTVWASYEQFEDWTKSDAFRASHAKAGQTGDFYVGPPHLELFDVVQEIKGEA